MNERTKLVYEEAQRLTADEQLDLARRLLASVVPGADPAKDIEAEWQAEAGRRLVQHQASPGPTYDAFETIDEIRQRLARRGR